MGKGARREAGTRQNPTVTSQVTDDGDLDQGGGKVDNEKLNSGYILKTEQ